MECFQEELRVWSSYHNFSGVRSPLVICCFVSLLHSLRHCRKCVVCTYLQIRVNLGQSVSGSRSPWTAMPDERTVPGVCRIFNSPKSECAKDDCQELHICFYFANGNCRFGDKCNRTHLLTTVHNKAVLRQNGWHYDNQHQKILKLLEEKFKPKANKPEEGKKADGLKTPQVCFTYNTLGCASNDCKNLHLCLNSVMDKCALGGKCPLEHDLVKSEHNIRVLRFAKLLDTEQQVITDSLKQRYIAMSNQQNKQQSKKKEAERNQKEKLAPEPKGKNTPLKHDNKEGKPKSRGTPCACIAYNKDGCNKASCPFLHVCFGYVMGSCDKKGNCLKEHNIFKGEQNIEVLRKFDLLVAKDVFVQIRAGYEARAAAKAAAIKSEEGASGGAAPPPPRAAQSRANPPASLTCSVCCEAFIRATTLGCSHTFCEDCVRRTERQGRPCPLCRAPITTAVRSLVIDDTVVDWFDGRDEETQLARRRLETERRRAAAVPQPLMATPAAPAGAHAVQPKANPVPKNKPPGGGQQRQRSKPQGRGAKTVVTTTVTYH